MLQSGAVTVRERIDDFLRQKRVAVVGVSRNPRHFSRSMLGEFRRRGYDAIAVSRHAAELPLQPSFSRLQDVTPPADAALLMTRPEMAESVLHDCAQAGIRRVWIYGITGKAAGASFTEFCARNGIDLISGFCPHMFFPQAGFPHRLHAFFMKLIGSYPR